MLIQFSVKNYKCFKEEVKLSMIASNYDKDTHWESNICPVPMFHLHLLKSAVIYGANASGKSKLLEALAFMKEWIYNSSKESQVNEPVPVEVFKFSSETEQEPSMFEIIFIYQNQLFRYGFEATKQGIQAEWLYHRPKTKEIEIFYRDKSQFEVHKNFRDLASLVKNNMVRHNALMLSVAAQFNNALAKDVFAWFDQLFILIDKNYNKYFHYTVTKLFDDAEYLNIMELIKKADIGIDDIKFLKQSTSKTKQQDLDLEAYTTIAFHKKYNELKEQIGTEYLIMDKEESFGTVKYFMILGFLLEALKKGKICIIDELDAELHSNLVVSIINLFHNEKINKYNAQLIFNTHNTNLLSANLFRRDQIFFTEKDRYGAASLYSLHDFTTEEGIKARKQEDFETNYIRGKYGAIPYLGEFDKLSIFQ